MRCIIKGCQNHDNEGTFDYKMCTPCSIMLKTGVIGHGTTFIHQLRDQLERARAQWAHEQTLHPSLPGD